MPSPSSSSSSHTIVPAPIATADTQHSCFICLQTDADPPNGPWVHACPCSLEAHEKCMLQWIAEMENTPRTSTDNRSSALRCQACRARIRVEEPRDSVVTLYNTFQRTYGRVSPMILLTIVSGGTLVGSAWYGWNALSVFAGSQAAYEWLTPKLPTGRLPRMPPPMFLATAAVRLVELSLIGPALVVLWWVPGAEFSLLPGSVLYAGSLVARGELLSWPPSPEWAMTLMPVVHVTYDFLYAEFLGPVEKRLNRVLRGRPATETPAAADQGNAEQGEAAPAEPNGERRGIARTALDWLGRLLRGPLGHVDEDQENQEEIQVEIQINLEDAGEEGEGDNAVADADDGADDLVEAIQGEFQMVPEPEERAQPQEQQPEAPEPDAQLRLEPREERQERMQRPIQDAQARRARRAEPQRAEEENNRQNRLVEEPRISIFSVIMNGMTTTLLFPAISYGMGELVRRVLPAAWTRSPTYRRPATGLLQYRWGRSLVGACLFFVLRDAFALYYKYRRVQVKLKRKVHNVERRNDRGTATAGADIPALSWGRAN
ncbi:hypothetical protein QBC34DRAFT_433999 [Podospora aff. communis PSN243]|uniref:RING-CH-type domain-containing protein n=1 Tax=Podospora aff. communis PSN243 TaxID=3040156 RepID=A0AAV9H5Y4_9PEZI|nr:hypothetical protein QBC34DRAFT_433999 [Podospora aff. communis PSN243]